MPLRWSDMDAYRHVNNVQFLHLLEDARVTGLEQWFGLERALLDQGVLVTRHEIEYRCVNAALASIPGQSAGDAERCAGPARMGPCRPRTTASTCRFAGRTWTPTATSTTSSSSASSRVSGFEQWFGLERALLDEGVLVTRHEIEYIAPLTFRHAPISVDMWCTKMSGAGFDLGYDVRDPDGVGEGHYARAETGLVLYDFASSGPRRMRPDEREILRTHEGDRVPFRWRSR